MYLCYRIENTEIELNQNQELSQNNRIKLEKICTNRKKCVSG